MLASLMLEAQRAFGLPFFDVSQGGDPLLWQHLFWIFGHPEVYIIFLPAAGLVSAMLPTLARTRLVAYRWLVLAVIGTAFLSFGLWVHHMYATGLPMLALSFFAGASMAVAIPSGIQVFAWIATLWDGRPRLGTPLLFVIGFIIIFVLGGLTGVMVALVPFDWQVHDTYFVVAHFHYVLIGGMVFPLFAALFFYMPQFSGRMLSERLGRVSFWPLFVGFNVAFQPMHLTGLLGMPRRVFSYPSEAGWNALNSTSSAGAYIVAAGVLVFVVNVFWHLRWGRPADVNPWNAPGLEWANATPTPDFNIRSIPEVRSMDPLWDQDGLLERIPPRGARRRTLLVLRDHPGRHRLCRDLPVPRPHRVEHGRPNQRLRSAPRTARHRPGACPAGGDLGALLRRRVRAPRRGMRDRRRAPRAGGLRAVLLALTLAATGAIALTGFLSYRTWRRWQPATEQDTAPQRATFLAQGTLLNAGLFLVATLWTGLPVLMFDPCLGHTVW